MSAAPGPDRDSIHPIARRLSFIEAASFGPRLTLVMAVLFAALVVTDVVHHRHEIFTWEGVWGFHAWFGFAAFTFVVLMGWPLRRLLSRPETYYGEGDEDA